MFRRRVEKPLLEAARLIGQAQTLRDAGRFREAADIYAELVRRFDEWPERREEGLRPSLAALGEMLWKCGDLKGAAEIYDRLAQFQHERGRTDGAEFAWEAAARILGEAHELVESELRARKAVAAAHELSDSVVMARAAYVLAQCLVLQGRGAEAEAYLLSSLNLELGESEDAVWARSGCYELLSRIAAERGDDSAARSWALKLQEMREAAVSQTH